MRIELRNIAEPPSKAFSITSALGGMIELLTNLESILIQVCEVTAQWQAVDQIVPSAANEGPCQIIDAPVTIPGRGQSV